LEQRHSKQRKSSNGLDRNSISSNEQQLPYFSFVINTICNVPVICDRDSSSFEETSNSSDMEGDFGSVCSDNDQSVDLEEEFADTLCRLACVMYSKPITGIHRYISSIIVPSGAD